MLQDMNKTIEDQKNLWIQSTLMKKFNLSSFDPTKFARQFGEYEVKQIGLEFILVYKSEIIGRFKPSLNFSVQK